jgi:hypothetical protein
VVHMERPVLPVLQVHEVDKQINIMTTPIDIRKIYPSFEQLNPVELDADPDNADNIAELAISTNITSAAPVSGRIATDAITVVDGGKFFSSAPDLVVSSSDTPTPEVKSTNTLTVTSKPAHNKTISITDVPSQSAQTLTLSMSSAEATSTVLSVDIDSSTVSFTVSATEDTIEKQLDALAALIVTALGGNASAAPADSGAVVISGRSDGTAFTAASPSNVTIDSLVPGNDGLIEIKLGTKQGQVNDSGVYDIIIDSSGDSSVSAAGTATTANFDINIDADAPQTTVSGNFAGVQTFTVASATNIKVGQVVTTTSGTIPANTTVTNVAGTSITVSNNVTLNNGNDVSFAALGRAMVNGDQVVITEGGTSRTYEYQAAPGTGQWSTATQLANLISNGENTGVGTSDPAVAYPGVNTVLTAGTSASLIAIQITFDVAAASATTAPYQTAQPNPVVSATGATLGTNTTTQGAATVLGVNAGDIKDELAAKIAVVINSKLNFSATAVADTINITYEGGNGWNPASPWGNMVTLASDAGAITVGNANFQSGAVEVRLPVLQSVLLNGVITSVTVVDQGAGLTAIPSITVSLPDQNVLEKIAQVGAKLATGSDSFAFDKKYVAIALEDFLISGSNPNELSEAEANATTGDYRKFAYHFTRKMWEYLNGLEQVVSISITTPGVNYQNNETFSIAGIEGSGTLVVDGATGAITDVLWSGTTIKTGSSNQRVGSGITSVPIVTLNTADGSGGALTAVLSSDLPSKLAMSKGNISENLQTGELSRTYSSTFTFDESGLEIVPE